MLTAKQVVDRYFLEARCQLLEVAAMLDRYDFAQPEGQSASDPRLEQLRQSLELLARREHATDRSERLLNLFSDPA